MSVESERNTKFILKKINEIVERSAGGKYIFRGEPKRYKKVASTLYRQYKKAIDSEHFDIEIVQEEIAAGSRKIYRCPQQTRNPDRAATLERFALVCLAYYGIG